MALGLAIRTDKPTTLRSILCISLSNGVIPEDADTWNAIKSPDFSSRPYQSIAGLPAHGRIR